MIKMILFMAIAFTVISNYSKTRMYLANDFGIAREHAALIVLAVIVTFGVMLANL